MSCLYSLPDRSRPIVSLVISRNALGQSETSLYVAESRWKESDWLLVLLRARSSSRANSLFQKLKRIWLVDRLLRAGSSSLNRIYAREVVREQIRYFRRRKESRWSSARNNRFRSGPKFKSCKIGARMLRDCLRKSLVNCACSHSRSDLE